jgi:hypothetical protein
VETLRCPKCLNRLVEGGVKRCPACGARLKTRGRSAPADDEMATRPRVLVERELQARIEAQTASGFRQRRRAAKTARRIAALPPSLFDAAGALMDTGNGSWTSTSAPNPVVIDLPVSAIHDVRPLRVESETVRVSEPEPLALVAPVIEIAPVKAVEPEPEPEREPEGEPAPFEAPSNRAHRRRAVRVEHRWRLRRANRPAADDEPGPAPEAAVTPLVDAAEVGEAASVVDQIVPEPVVIAEPEPEPVVAEPEPEPVVAGESEPEPEPRSLLAATLEAVVVATGEPEPEPFVAAVVEPAPEPEPVVAAAPKPELVEQREPAPAAPRGAVDWEPSTSLWARRVFDAGSKRQRAVTWPRPCEPPPQDHLARDYIDAEVAEPARTD